MNEADRFIQIKHIYGKHMAVFRKKHIYSDGKSEMLLDENSLRMRLANLKKGGYPHDQTQAALMALEEAAK